MGLRSRVSNAWNAFVGRKATTLQRSIAVGHTPGYPVSNHREELEHFTGWNYVAVHTIAKQWAQATVCVYDKSEEIVKKSHDSPAEERKPLPNHEIAKLLASPNPLMGQQEFLYLVACQCHLPGGYVIWEIRNLAGKPSELWVLPKAWLTYQRPVEGHPLGLWRVYNPRGLTGYYGGNQLANGFYIDLRDTIIGGWPHPLYPGETCSPLAACAAIIDISEKADEAITASLINSPRPGMVVLLGDAMLTDEQIDQMRASIKEFNAGVHNAGNVLAVQGAKLDKPGALLSDLEATEIREQNRKFSLGIQGVPSIATGAADEMTAAGASAVLNNFTEQTVQPGLNLFFGKLSSRWKPIYGDDFDVEAESRRYDDPALEQQVSDAIKDAVTKGLATGNEWRARVKLPPLPELEKIQQPPQPGAMPGQPGAQPAEQAAPDDTGDEFDLEPDLGADDNADAYDLEPRLLDKPPAFSTNGRH